MIDTSQLLRSIEREVTHAFDKTIKDAVAWQHMYPILTVFMSAHGYWIDFTSDTLPDLDYYVHAVKRQGNQEPLFISTSEVACFEYILNQIKAAQPSK